MGWHDVCMEFYENLPCSLEIIVWAAGHSIAVIISYICIVIKKKKEEEKKLVPKIVMMWFVLFDKEKWGDDFPSPEDWDNEEY
jgi:hypothetical protein